MKEASQNELLSAYLDGELSAEDRARVEQLLTEDATARQTLDALRAVSASLKGLPTHRLDEDLSDRVLRAAERRILAEPTRLADAPRSAAPAKPLSVRRLVRRLFSPRGLAWSGLAVAIAILLMVFHTEPPGSDGNVAKAPEESKPPSTAPALVAADEAHQPPAEGEPASLGPAHSAKDVVRLKVAKSGAQPALEPATEHLAEKKSFGAPKAASGLKSDFFGDRERPKAARQMAPTATEQALEDDYGYQRPASKDHPHAPSPATPLSETIATKKKAHPYRSAGTASKGKAMSESVQVDTDLFEEAQSESQTARLARRSPARTTLAGTALRRAVRNQAAVPIVNCVLSAKALQKDAFTQTLAANDIELVEISPGDEHLAQQLVADFVRPSTRAGQQKVRYLNGIGRERQMDVGNALSESKAPEMSPARADQTARSQKLQRQLVRDARQSADELLRSQEAGAVKVVLVEGTERQIAATLAQLTQRKDVAVSIPSQPSAVFTTDDGRWFRAMLDGQRRAKETLDANASRLRSRKSGEPRPTQEALNGLVQQTTPKAEFLAKHVDRRGRGQQRGTAQVLGIVREADQASITGPSLSFIQPSTPATTPPPAKPADQPLATRAGAAAPSQVAAPGSPAMDRLARDEKQSTVGKGVGGMEGMGSGARQRAGAGTGGQYMPQPGLSRRPELPAKSPSSASKADESEKQNELVTKLVQTLQKALKPADDEAGRPLRQVLFVIRTVSDRQLPPAAAAPVEAKTEQKQEAANSTEKPD